GGSLIGRVQRLMVPAQVETFPRWMAGLVVAALVVTIGGGTTLAARAEALDAGAQLSASDLAADATRTAPGTVLRYAGPARPLADRWDWASAQARRLGTRRFWVGYSVHGRAVSEHPTSLDRERRVTGREDAGFRGVRLAPLVGAREDADDIAFLFRYTTRADGRPVPTRAHVSSLALPVDFGRRDRFADRARTDAPRSRRAARGCGRARPQERFPGTRGADRGRPERRRRGCTRPGDQSPRPAAPGCGPRGARRPGADSLEPRR